MPQPTFTVIANPDGTDRIFEIPASGSLWTYTAYIAGPVKLKIEVVDPTAVWQFADDSFCRADGTTRNDPGTLLIAAPVGALIGKLGGSTADFPPAPGLAGPTPLPAGIKAFAVGTFAIIDVQAADSGPLFLAMNDVLTGRPHHQGVMKVKISTGA